VTRRCTASRSASFEHVAHGFVALGWKPEAFQTAPHTHVNGRSSFSIAPSLSAWSKIFFNEPRASIHAGS
jgi:hypothetical protein